MSTRSATKFFENAIVTGWALQASSAAVAWKGWQESSAQVRAVQRMQRTRTLTAL